MDRMLQPLAFIELFTMYTSIQEYIHTYKRRIPPSPPSPPLSIYFFMYTCMGLEFLFSFAQVRRSIHTWAFVWFMYGFVWFPH